MTFGRLAKVTLRSTRFRNTICGENTLLPFLFQTRTIVRGYTAQAQESKNEADVDDAASDGTENASAGLSTSTLNRHVQRFHPGGEANISKVKPSGQHRQQQDHVYENTLSDHEELDQTGRPTRREYRPQLSSGHVPFEGLPQTPDLDADLEGSTITPTERRAFQSILTQGRNSGSKISRGQSKTVQPHARTNEKISDAEYERRASSLDALLDTALAGSEDKDTPKLPSALRSTVEAARDISQARHRRTVEAKTRRTRRGRLAKAEMSEREVAAQEEIERNIQEVREKMRNAETDLGIWEVLREAVIDRLVALGFDGKRGFPTTKLDSGTSMAENGVRTEFRDKVSKPPQTTLNTSDGAINIDPGTSEITDDGSISSRVGTQERNIESTDEAPSSAITTPNTMDTSALADILSSHVENAQACLIHHFPSSPLTLSILPTIRSISPAAAAFTLSTRHYEQHMIASWKQFQDPSTIITTLRDMDANVIPFDVRTVAVIDRALRFAKRAREGRFGPSVSVLWKMEGKTRALGELVRWKEVVKERLAEEALKRARDEEVKEALEGEIGRGGKVRFMDGEKMVA